MLHAICNEAQRMRFTDDTDRKFSKINYKREGLHTLLKKLWETESNDQRHEIGRPKHAPTEENVTTVNINW